jgi:hypothetical protein
MLSENRPARRFSDIHSLSAESAPNDREQRGAEFKPIFGVIVEPDQRINQRNVLASARVELEAALGRILIRDCRYFTNQTILFFAAHAP